LLGDALQARLRARHAYRSLDQCDNYHWFDLPDGSTFEGWWDLRQSWRKYLGDVALSGKRVLEIGPACGFLSLQMERDGAEVVALDVRPGVPQDLISSPHVDNRTMQAHSIARIERFRATWWYFHSLYGSRNKAVYADIYDIPTEIGRFDVGVAASVLLHIARPYEALRQVAKLTDHALVVTDVLDPVASENGTMRFNPFNELWTWWGLSPEICESMLRTLGFTHFVHRRHTHTCHPRDNRESAGPVTMPLFTVVAMRSPGAVTIIEP
jgi:hypothetical protein